jgi:hypothetical protein
MGQDDGRKPGTDANPTDLRMKTTESMEEVEVESRLVKGARLTFLGSLLFWPLFVFAVAFMLGAPGKTVAAEVERTILVYSTWLYPIAVGLGWFLCKRGLRRARPDIVCLLPWLIPALVFCYWLVYFLL